MRIATPILVLLLTPLLLLACSAPETFKISPEDEDWEIFFPAEPTEESESDVNNFGEIKVRRFALESENGGPRYELAYHDYPDAIALLGESWQLLDARRKNMALSFKGEQRGEHKIIDLGDYEGQSFTIELPEDRVLLARIYYVDSRIYQVTVDLPAADEDSGDAARFLDSFGFVY